MKVRIEFADFFHAHTLEAGCSETLVDSKLSLYLTRGLRFNSQFELKLGLPCHLHWFHAPTSHIRGLMIELPSL